MGKCVNIIVSVVTIFFFIAGCTTAPAATLSPGETKNRKIEPNEPAVIEPQAVAAAEPNERAPGIEPNEVKPTEAEPNIPALIKAEPNNPEPPKTEPNEAKPIKAEPNEPRVTKGEPNEVKSPNVEAGKGEPNQAKPSSAISFHDKFADILKIYVNNRGMVNYKELRYKRPELKNLLDEFANLDPNEYNRWPKEDKIALWINAYNIQMLKIITDNYPIAGSRFLNPIYGSTSIRHIKGIWTSYKFIVMDEEFTLAEIDRRFLTKEFDEPGIFFAICLASYSSPPLRNEPYYGYKLYQQLEDQVKKSLSNPEFFRIDRENKKVYLSAILHPTWRGKEFVRRFGTDKKFKDQEPETRAVLSYISKYLPQQDVDFLEVGNYSVKFLRYDWTLNDGS